MIPLQPEHLYTLSEIIGFILAICGGIGILGTAVAHICKLFGWIRKPEEHQNEVLKDHEKRLVKIEEKLDRDYKHLQELDQTMKLMLEAQMALLDHAIDNNHINNVKDSKRNIDKYLRSKIGGD